MNSLQLDTGGRPVANDDFKVLQDRDALLGLPALLSGLGPCVVSGCRVYQTGSQYNVGPGMVWDGSQLLDFPGRSNVTLPAMFAPGAVAVVDERAYQTGGTKTTIKGQSMDLVAVVAGATNLVVSTWGALTFWHRTQEKTRVLGDVKYVASFLSTDYDADGLGKPGTLTWGWALCDGRDNRANLQGQFVVGIDLTRADYDTIGKTGGEETHVLSTAEIPDHDHGASAPCNDTNNTGNGQAYQKVDAGQGTDRNRRTGRTGGGRAHENRPPFYVLGVVQWVGY